MSRAEFRLGLGHFGECRLARLLCKSYGYSTDVKIQHDFGTLRRPPQKECGTQSGMPGERQFFLYREDSNSFAMFALRCSVARKHERRLRKVCFPGQRLHFFRGQPGGIVDNGKGISRKRLGSEDVQLGEGEATAECGHNSDIVL